MFWKTKQRNSERIEIFNSFKNVHLTITYNFLSSIKNMQLPLIISPHTFDLVHKYFWMNFVYCTFLIKSIYFIDIFSHEFVTQCTFNCCKHFSFITFSSIFPFSLEKHLQIMFEIWATYGLQLIAVFRPHWYPGSGVVLYCIDSLSLHTFLLRKDTKDHNTKLDQYL